MNPYNVLFLCTGNSARSVIGEALLKHWGKGRFRAYSAGSFPKGEINPYAIEILKSMNLSTDGLRSKSWDEFAGPDAPKMDFVITVCGRAAGEVCPIWPGNPATAHWDIADPAAAEGDHTRKLAAFWDAYLRLEARINLFISLPLDKLDRTAIKSEIANIEAIASATAAAS
jgi:arsenate reductase